MNKRDWIVLSVIQSGGYGNQRSLVARTGYSLGMVNASLQKLQAAGWLDRDYHATGQVTALLEHNRPRQAVILAAGMGLRMLPYHHTPKGLLEVNGEVLIERILRQLRQAGVERVTVVTGYRAERFDYLQNRFGAELRYNPDFTGRDSLRSLALAADRLENSYVVGSDIWYARNPFSPTEYCSWYAVSETSDPDSPVRINRKMELVRTQEGREGRAMLGLGYLLTPEAKLVRARLEQLEGAQAGRKAEWEEALFQEDGKLLTYARVMQGQAAYGLKTAGDLHALDSASPQLSSELSRLIDDVQSYAQALSQAIRADYPRPVASNTNDKAVEL